MKKFLGSMAKRTTDVAKSLAAEASKKKSGKIIERVANRILKKSMLITMSELIHCVNVRPSQQDLYLEILVVLCPDDLLGDSLV